MSADLPETVLRAPGRGAGQLARNAASGAGRHALPALLALAVTPYALHTLGEARFGLWALAGVVLTLSRVLDLGLQRAIVREVARAAGAGAVAGAAPALGAGRGAMAVLGLAYVAGVWLMRDALVVDVLRLPAELHAEGVYVLVGTAAVAALETFVLPYQAALDGVGRMDVSSAVDAAQRVASALGVVAVLAAGWGLPGLVWKNLAAAALAGLAYRMALGRLAPELARARLRLDRRRVRRLLSFGRHVQAVNASMLVLETGAKLTVGRGPGVAAVATFELAWRVVAQAGGALLGASTAVFPAAAERHGERRGDPVATVALYRSATRYLSWATLPAYGLIMALAGPFVLAWVGAGQERAGAAMAVLAGGFLVGVLAAPAHMVAQATGRERISTAAALVSVLSALGVWAVWVPSHGLMAVAAGVGVGVGAGGVTAWVLFARALRSGWSTVTCLGWQGPLAAAVAALAARAVAAAVAPGMVGVIAAAAVGLALFAVTLAAGGGIGPRERALLRAALARNGGGDHGARGRQAGVD